MHKLVIVLSFLLLPFIVTAQKNWNAVTQDISFKIKNAGITVNGTFDGGHAELFFSPDHLSASSLKARVEVKTIKTGIGLRDEHLKGETYFNADTFKTINIESKSLYIKGNNYAGMFNVTIKGVTKQIEIPFEFNQIADEAVIKGSFTLNRRDFGVGGKSLTMSDEVTVKIEIKAKS
jgi:polyisoprenoid-binding protein YceI